MSDQNSIRPPVGRAASTAPDIYVARQAIYDRQQRLAGYELFYRSGRSESYDASNGDCATAQVLVNALLTMGLDEITDGSQVHIRFTTSMLLGQYVTAFPRKSLVVEILSTVEPCPQVIAVCQRLKREGYPLAVSKAIWDEAAWRPIIALADIVKVDFQRPGPAAIEFPHVVGRYGPRLLATRIEADYNYERAVEAGYDLFEGYHFSEPETLEAADIPGCRAHRLHLLRLLAAPSLDLAAVGLLVKSDVSLTYKLLCYHNSAAVRFRRQTDTVPQALASLGEREIRKWASLVCLSYHADDEPHPLLLTSVVWALFAEGVARLLHLETQRDQYYLLGLLSQLPELMGQPSDRLLNRLMVADEVREALGQGTGLGGDILRAAAAYQDGNQRRFEALMAQNNINPVLAARTYDAAAKIAPTAFHH